MWRSLQLLLLLLLFVPTYAFGSHGMITVESSHSTQVTADRLEPILKEKGMTVFSRIDHAAGALGIGETLRPTILFIFGNPRAGTALMKCNQTAGIDLPLKILIWEDDMGLVKLTYNDPRYIADRHGISDCGQILEKMTGALKGFAEKATMK
jgi:uncharacterized protein (DUF302 family)